MRAMRAGAHGGARLATDSCAQADYFMVCGKRRAGSPMGLTLRREALLHAAGSDAHPPVGSCSRRITEHGADSH